MGLVLQPADGGKYQRVGTFRSLPTTAAPFYAVDLQEFEFSPTFNYSAWIEKVDGEDGFHPGVYC
jgi:hypothetical protein